MQIRLVDVHDVDRQGLFRTEQRSRQSRFPRPGRPMEDKEFTAVIDLTEVHHPRLTGGAQR
eukprot:9240229-Pyramimonas_sp.AAC.1